MNIVFDPLDIRKKVKYLDEYASCSVHKQAKQNPVPLDHIKPIETKSNTTDVLKPSIEYTPEQSSSLVLHSGAADNSRALTRRMAFDPIKPVWHPPWKLYRVIAGHLGWVRSVAIDPQNEWFVTGSSDRTIKIWDLASGTLKLSLTGHINAVRALAVSRDHCYMYSAGEDKKVMCWDLESNKVIRKYHGHRSGVYCMALHPSIDILMTGGRDSSLRVWDIRTQNQITILEGHTNTISDVVSQSAEPQVITGSHDGTIRLWDLAISRTAANLTHHKKSVRALQLHPSEYSFCSGSSDNIKVFKCPDGQFLRNISGHNAVINTLALNQDNVLVSGADNGSLRFWDWSSGYCFQQEMSKVQPGSLDAEAGIFQMCFDKSGSRLITCEADKTIKMWKEDEEATPETHPINFVPQKRKRNY